VPVILKFITRLGIQQGTSHLYGLTPLAACQVGGCCKPLSAVLPQSATSVPVCFVRIPT
jgi:hypothetical protein